VPLLIDQGNKYPARITTTKVDVSNAQQVDSWVKDTVSLFGKLDGAANIAGIAGGDGQTTENIVSDQRL
jgi:NAD(P)-dependent dehydrogenase (short-subunit alcohol dehydrogenase family)